MYKLLITDLDNTLYDWYGYFVPSFYAMVDRFVVRTKCDRDKLLDDFRDVHKHHGTTEVPFGLLQTKTFLNLRHSDEQFALQAAEEAFHQFNSTRKQTLKLYDGVKQTLECIGQANIRIVAYTESDLYASVDRIDRLHVSDYISRIYCRNRVIGKHPNADRATKWLQRPTLGKTVELSPHKRKPDPATLREIVEREGVQISESVYVGDSMARDVVMARRAGVKSVWAKYGSASHGPTYDLLVRISHWSHEDVQREKQIQARVQGVEPDHIAFSGYSDILSILEVECGATGNLLHSVG